MFGEVSILVANIKKYSGELFSYPTFQKVEEIFTKPKRAKDKQISIWRGKYRINLIWGYTFFYSFNKKKKHGQHYDALPYEINLL